MNNADQLPIRPVDEGSQVRISHAHYLEICQARVDDRKIIENMKAYILLQEQGIERLEVDRRALVRTIDRLQEDRRELLSALREIRQAAPDEEPGNYVHPLIDPELRGYDKAAWDAGEIARQAIEKVGASLHVDIPRRRTA
jgi:hypothetical protein